MSDEMDCDGLRKVLFDHVDGLLGREEADAARDHLAACGPCRSLQEEVRRNFSALDAWEDEEIPPGAFDRLRTRLPVTGLLGTGLPGGPRPVLEIGRGAGIGEASPAGAGVVVRRRWLRLAVPYAAGLATAAAAAWFLVLPHGTVPSPILHAAPGAAPDAAPVALDGGVPPAARPVASNGTSPAAPAATPLRAGERKLEFRDVERGVFRTVRFPSDVDPASLELLPDLPRFLPDDEGVR